MQYQARGDYRAIMPGQDALLHLTQQNAMDHSGGSAVSSAFSLYLCHSICYVLRFARPGLLSHSSCVSCLPFAAAYGQSPCAHNDAR